MKKVFMMVALVMACTTGSHASETVAENVSTAEMCSLSAKKTTKKKKATTKKKSTTTAKKNNHGYSNQYCYNRNAYYSYSSSKRLFQDKYYYCRYS